jgi:DNA-binding MarR family transcriptional regulator/GNAT superfamily N-acetyltransferase
MRQLVEHIRHFNRFYTEQIGVVSGHLLRSRFSLTEVRILYEVANRDDPTAAQIASDLKLDRGQMSRTLARFQRQGIIGRVASPDDGRARLLSLTAKGKRLFRGLDARANDEIAGLLRDTGVDDRRRLIAAMREIEGVLGPRSEAGAQFVIRGPRPGDLGWIVHRHGVLYAQEYRYDERFEALVAKIVGEFAERFDARRERCWIAEKDGMVVGSVFLVRESDAVAKLRLLYVEPSARGFGIGRRLIDECVRFARGARYRKIALWTQSELLAARRLYEKAGFVRLKEQPHRSFGRDDLVAETWDLTL